MVGNTLGRIFKVTTWGESHGRSIGCVIDGCPAGLKVSEKEIADELKRDTPYPILSSRLESNNFEVLSGIFEGETIGTPISIMINNDNIRSETYQKNRDLPRPGHADLTYRMKYGHIDWRGGSRASGRTWISVVAAGAFARKICSMKGIEVRSRVLEMGGNSFEDGDMDSFTEKIANDCRDRKDSTGGSIEVSIDNLPKGLGAPAFGRFQADLGHGILNIPGVRSFELGNSRVASASFGSENNDGLYLEEGEIRSRSNNSGGVLGGITYGDPVVFSAVVKPTPSILKEQRTVDLRKMEETSISTQGRFDVNYTPRVLVIAEAISTIVTVDHLMLSGHLAHDSIIPIEERLGYSLRNEGPEL